MAINLIYRTDIEKVFDVQTIPFPFYQGDVNAHRIRIEVLENGVGCDLDGYTAQLIVVDPEGQKHSFDCELTGSVITALLPREVYHIPGRVSMVIKLVDDESITTIWACTVMVEQIGGDEE